MIGTRTLLLLGMKSLQEYFDIVLTNFTDNAIRMAKDRFDKLSPKQRKEFFAYLSESHKISSEDPMYQFFFELL